MEYLKQGEKRGPKPHYSKQQLATLYGIDVRTFKKRIAAFESELGAYEGNSYSEAQVQVIFDKLGIPIGLGRNIIKGREENSGQKECSSSTSHLLV